MHSRMDLIGVLAATAFSATALYADGVVRPPRDYAGSLEERAQEAVIIFQQGRESTEDLILKIQVAGDVDNFAWIVPFPNAPQVEREDAALFKELFDYVESRNRSRAVKSAKGDGAKSGAADERSGAPVEVLSQETVGSYDVAVVRENEPGRLNAWLADNGYEPLEDAEETIEFYRQKDYVFACIKVDEAEADAGDTVDLHPLRFTFGTGGRDGIYFPMKLTGLQAEPFDVNLYVFHRAWLNDALNKFGYRHRGFHLNHRDWDSPQCVPNGGKSWSDPSNDPFLRSYAARLPTIARLLQNLHPGERYYLTNIQASGVKPADVRKWQDDLWLFPYYTNRSFVPYDARPGGVATAAWPGQPVTAAGTDPDAVRSTGTSLWRLGRSLTPGGWMLAGLVAGVVLGLSAAWWVMRRSRRGTMAE